MLQESGTLPDDDVVTPDLPAGGVHVWIASGRMSVKPHVPGRTSAFGINQTHRRRPKNGAPTRRLRPPLRRLAPPRGLLSFQKVMGSKKPSVHLRS